jgi:3-mercaptopyruvate sulfurtransferase SseA
MSRLKILWILLLAVAALAACQAATPTSVATATQAGNQAANGSETLPQTREEVPRITLDELRDQLASPRKMVLIDTRSRTEYEAAHIPGAISMPYAEVEARYRELPRATQIVTYCA